MRSNGVAAAAALVLVLVTGGVAAAAGSGPARPTVAACVKAWNAAPALEPMPVTHRARIVAIAAHTFTVTWSKSSSVAASGPGCIVSVPLAGSRGLTIVGTWSGAKPIHWRAPIRSRGLTSAGLKTNGVIRASGQIALG